MAKNPATWSEPTREDLLKVGYSSGQVTYSNAFTQYIGDIRELVKPVADWDRDSLLTASWTLESAPQSGWSAVAVETAHWLPPTRNGRIVNIGYLKITDNSGNLIVTNSGKQLVTDPSYIAPLETSAWDSDSLNTSSWNHEALNTSSWSANDKDTSLWSSDSLLSSAWTNSEDSTDLIWLPADRHSHVVNQGYLNITDNLGSLLVTNSGLQIVTNPTYIAPINTTLWDQV